MSCSESSMLSDELKPRRTPEPTRLQEFIPRPSVPDLSIIELPQPRNTKTVSSTPYAAERSHIPQVSTASYSEWHLRSKQTESPSSIQGPKHPTSTQSSQNGGSAFKTQRTVLDRLSDSAPPLGLSDFTHPAQQAATYADFSKRPTSAPAANAKLSQNGYRQSMVPNSQSVNNQLFLPNGPNPLFQNANGQMLGKHIVPRTRQSSFGQQTGRNVMPPAVRPTVNDQAFIKNVPAGIRQTPPSGSTVAARPNQQESCSKFPPGNYISTNNNVMPSTYPESSLVQLPQHAIHHRALHNHAHVNHVASSSQGHYTTEPVAQNVTPVSILRNDHHTDQFYSPTQNHANSVSCTSACCLGHEQYSTGRQYIHPPVPIPNHHVSSASGVHPDHLYQCPVTQLNSEKAMSESFRVSYDDLYKIVLAQSSQLKALQSQVEKLLISQEQHRSSQPEPHHTNRNTVSKALPSVTSHQHSTGMVSEEATQTSDYEPNQENCQKMSIGVMTSFIHTVAYSGRVGLLDAMNGVPPTQQQYSSGGYDANSSDDHSSSSSATSQSPPREGKSCLTGKCCHGCHSEKREDQITKKPCMVKQKAVGRKSADSKRCKTSDSLKPSGLTCPPGCHCKDPGVSAAIMAVRGCRAELLSKTGQTVDDSMTFNAADIPSVTEPPVSPPSSIHVDIQDYHDSSSDESSSGSVQASLLEEDEDEIDKENDSGRQGKHGKPKGWTFYNNVLGQVNQILQENDGKEHDIPNQHGSYGKQIVPTSGPKGTDVSTTLKRVAFKPQGDECQAQNLKELALKYLRENHPEELAASGHAAASQTGCGERVQDMAVYNMACGTNNMSFATFRYLERYNLLPENFNPQNIDPPPNLNINGFRGKHTPVEGSDNIHDFIRNGYKSPRNGATMQPKVCRQKSRQTEANFDPNGHHRPRRRHTKHVNHHVLSPQRPFPKKQIPSNTPTSKILDITALRQQPKLL